MTEFLLDPPAEFGLDKFPSWRQGQDQLILDLAARPERFVGLNAATGVGKSLIYNAVSRLSGFRRGAVLTSTKGLQDQLQEDFPFYADVRGMANYPCWELLGRKFDADWQVPRNMRCDNGPCLNGRECEYKANGCGYYDAVRKAVSSRWVKTNYAYWTLVQRHTGGLGEFDVLVCDEAHDVPDAICAAMSTDISALDLATWKLTEVPRVGDLARWKSWAKDQLDRIPGDELGVDIDMLRQWKSIRGRLQVLLAMDDRWIGEQDRDHNWSFQPVWPMDYAEQVLFCGIKKIILSSATMTPKTLDLLGIKAGDFYMAEADSPFPVEDRPFISVETTRVDSKTNYAGPWLRRIDEIVGARLDRKGIIHTTSYDRAKLIMEQSKHRDVMLSHTSWTTREVVQAFKDAPAPAVLVSPSVTTGYDFPGAECEYQIIGKIPFADTRSPVAGRRHEEDKDYGRYTAAQILVQIAGRGVRFKGDRAETIIIDDNWVDWFRHAAKKHLPKWFKKALRYETRAPKPLPKMKA